MTDTNKKTVLIIDDEYEYRNVLKIQLSEEGFTIVDVENGEQGLEYIKGQDNDPVDLIILDQFMPLMDGQTFLYHMKKVIDRDIPILMLTNYDSAAHQEGIREFVVKSNINLDQLVAKVRHYIGQAS